MGPITVPQKSLIFLRELIKDSLIAEMRIRDCVKNLQIAYDIPNGYNINPDTGEAIKANKQEDKPEAVNEQTQMA